jgi:DnaJ family protein C protein 28
MDEAQADEVILKLERIAERRIREAIEAGEFDNLEGMGKPLSTDDENPYVPEDMRVAFKVLQNSGYAPDWMTLAQDIEADLDRLRASADVHFRVLREQLKEITADTYAITRLRTEVQRLKSLHKRAAARHERAIQEVNRKINTFNQTVPIASLLKVPLSVEDEMRRYEDRLPAYLGYVQ